MVKVAELLLERVSLDGAEVRAVMSGIDVPPPPSGGMDNADHETQQVIRPESTGRRLPGLNEGEQPA